MLDMILDFLEVYPDTAPCRNTPVAQLNKVFLLAICAQLYRETVLSSN
jgi:hypothetical protein